MRPLQRLKIERLELFFVEAHAQRDTARLCILRDELAERRGHRARALAARVALALGGQPMTRAA
ncbi:MULTISPECIES: hypothetical protein [unclassified Chelatococcus]|uniref:hypothetical protein n=1 Tax=unclassified Chelatococcus TaxID=2638111 RepID=UPI0002DA0794|nr:MULTISPECIES: hypothetical protein [unclassified Chelatococcus]ALA17188.1 hypothetical protein AL346_06930 [Chelatococcus sp. CO-6]